jgi:hypothetical protein
MDEEKVTGKDIQEPERLDYCRLVAEFSPMPMAAVVGVGHILRYVNLAFCRKRLRITGAAASIR